MKKDNMKLSVEEQAQLLAIADVEEREENKEMWLNKCPQISLFVKKAIYYALYYVLNNRNRFNELPMTKEDLNTVTGYVDLFEESRAEDDNVLIQSIQGVLIQSIQGVLDRLVETSDKEVKQDIAKEFMSNLKKDGF